MTGEFLKHKLSVLRMTSADIARSIGIQPQGLQKVYSSKDIKTSVIERICEAKHIPVTFFFEDMESPLKVENNVNSVQATNVASVSGNVTGVTQGSNDSDLVKSLMEQNKMLMEQNKDLTGMLKLAMSH